MRADHVVAVTVRCSRVGHVWSIHSCEETGVESRWRRVCRWTFLEASQHCVPCCGAFPSMHASPGACSPRGNAGNSMCVKPRKAVWESGWILAGFPKFD